jgi:hypothetical protein
MRVRRRSRAFSVLVACVLVCLFAAVGFRAGQIVRPSAADAAGTWQSAAAASYSHARTSAYAVAWKRAYINGWRDGTSAARRAGARAGRAAGSVQAAARAVAARALADALAASPRRLERSATTEACVPVSGGLCDVLGPAVTGKACPPSSVAYPEGGAVCIPRLLLLVARTGG